VCVTLEFRCCPLDTLGFTPRSWPWAQRNAPMNPDLAALEPRSRYNTSGSRRSVPEYPPRRSMMQRFNAWVASKGEKGPQLAWTGLREGDLMDGNVTVRVSHSTLNYKDALALTGKAPIIRRWPMIPGIDLAGAVVASSHPDFKAGDEVILNGWEAGVSHYGGHCQMARLNGGWLGEKPASSS